MRHLVKSQDGVALPVASAMMLVIALFVVAFFTVSLRVNDTSVEDRSSKRALAAAEAGLQTAVYRMNRIGTSVPTGCFTTAWVSVGGTSPCPSITAESLGNGAQYTYTVSRQGAACVGTGAATDRCITAVGTVNGVDRRVQVRVSTLTGAVSFKSVGLMSKSLMYAGDSSEIRSNVGVNGVAHFGNSAKTFANPAGTGAVLRAPGSTYETSGSSQVIAGGQQSVSTPFVFPPIKWAEAELAAATTNLRTTTPWSVPSGSSYSATTKQFTVTGDALMPAGTYLFCRVHFENSAKLRFSSTQPTQIYVDSPSRVGSLCTGQADPAGTFTAFNSNEINKDGREELLEIFLHGTGYNGGLRYSWCTPSGDSPHTDKCEGDFLLNNSSAFRGSVYAPDATVELNNSASEFIGAIGADKIRFNNSVKFELTAAMQGSATPTTTGVARGDWIECPPAGC